MLFLGEGLALLQKARKTAPEDSQVAFNLAAFYQQLGAAARARAAWTAYLELDSDSEWADVARESLESLGVE
jgi:Flp pilus assembly protein TadD